MKRLSLSLLCLGLLTGSLLSISTANAADPKPKADAPKEASGEKPKAKRDWYPFYGTVASVDKQAHTVSLKKKEGVRTLKTDAKSTIEIEGKPGSLADIKAGSYAHGTLHKDSSGAEVILSAKFDKEAPAKAGAKGSVPTKSTTSTNRPPPAPATNLRIQ